MDEYDVSSSDAYRVHVVESFGIDILNRLQGHSGWLHGEENTNKKLLDELYENIPVDHFTFTHENILNAVSYFIMIYDRLNRGLE